MSFWPKYTRLGCTILNSLVQTVATPRKKTGREAPSSHFASGVMVANDPSPSISGLQQAATWGLTYCGQLVCARVGGTAAPIAGVIAALVGGEIWRPFGEALGGAVVATCGAIAGGFALAYVAAMAPQWSWVYS